MNEHRAVNQLIRTYEKELSELGKVRISNVETKMNLVGRKNTYYELNEPQASFLMTLLKNNKVVVAFKLELVKEFYRMRQFILQQSTEQWKEARNRCKLTRNIETDVLRSFIEYAKIQGSEKADMYYIHFSNIVNNAVSLKPDERDTADYRILSTIEILEDLILHTLNEQMILNIHYKDIYKSCKYKVNEIMKFIYLPKQELAIAN